MTAKSRWARGALVAAACMTVGVVTAAPVAARTASEPGSSPQARVVAVTNRVPIYLDPTPHDTTVAERPVAQARSARAATATSTINVTYHGFTTQAKAAFQKAVDIWSANIVSAVPIEVDATWSALPPTSSAQPDR